jgi:hypothetical protein
MTKIKTEGKLHDIIGYLTCSNKHGSMVWFVYNQNQNVCLFGKKEHVGVENGWFEADVQFDEHLSEIA